MGKQFKFIILDGEQKKKIAEEEKLNYHSKLDEFKKKEGVTDSDVHEYERSILI